MKDSRWEITVELNQGNSQGKQLGKLTKLVPSAPATT